MVTTLTLLDLLRKAAAHKGLKLQEGASNAYSETIKEYVLDQRLLAVLAKRGIKQQPRPDCHGVFTLVDENPQEPAPGYHPSNCWNFEFREGEGRMVDLRVALRAGFMISREKRGVELVPKASGTVVSPVDRLPNERMFKALVESDDDTPAVAKELAASDGSVVVTWTELGLGGVRRLADLFAEFAAGNETVHGLAHRQMVFDPAPHRNYIQPGDVLFVPESAQPEIFRTWRKQLDAFRARLVA